eukprot:COSAG06_NODE_22027_length_737_cov_0.822884_1_plen_107_part_10
MEVNLLDNVAQERGSLESSAQQDELQQPNVFVVQKFKNPSKSCCECWARHRIHVRDSGATVHKPGRAVDPDGCSPAWDDLPRRAVSTIRAHERATMTWRMMAVGFGV